MTTQTNIVICVPTFGAPYIHYEFSTNEEWETILKTMNEEEQQEMKPFNERLVINPMFCEEKTKTQEYWSQVDFLNKRKIGKWYADDDSMKWSVNTGTIVNMRTRYGCPHVFGEMYLVVNVEEMKKWGLEKEYFQTFEEYKNFMDGSDEEESDDE